MTATMAAQATSAPPYPKTPVIDQTMAILCLIVNIFVPGLGTIISGVIGQKPLIGRGIAQFFLAIIIVGWVWGIVTGIQLLQNAVWKEKHGAAPPPQQGQGPSW